VVVVVVVVEEDCVSGLTPRTRLLDGFGVGSGKAGEGEADRARRLPDAREVNVEFATAAESDRSSRCADVAVAAPVERGT